MRVCASEGDLSAQGMALTSGEKPRAAQSVGRVDCSVSLGRQASHVAAAVVRARSGICTNENRERDHTSVLPRRSPTADENTQSLKCSCWLDNAPSAVSEHVAPACSLRGAAAP